MARQPSISLPLPRMGSRHGVIGVNRCGWPGRAWRFCAHNVQPPICLVQSLSGSLQIAEQLFDPCRVEVQPGSRSQHFAPRAQYGQPLFVNPDDPFAGLREQQRHHAPRGRERFQYLFESSERRLESYPIHRRVRTFPLLLSLDHGVTLPPLQLGAVSRGNSGKEDNTPAIVPSVS